MAKKTGPEKAEQKKKRIRRHLLELSAGTGNTGAESGLKCRPSSPLFRRLLHWIVTHFNDELTLGKAAIFGTMWEGVRPYRDESHQWYVPKEVYDKDE